MTEYLQDTSDEKIIELVNDLYELYVNPDIVNYIHNGKTLPFKYQSLLSRLIPGIYSNIEKKPSIQIILTNAIKFSLNMSTQTKNTNELKMYRESCERFKTALSILIRKKQQGHQVDENDIENKIKEIKMLEQKINEIATIATFKPEINKKILNNAITIYNVMLRNDRIPKIVFIKFSKKIGYNFNYAERFVDEYDKTTSFNGIPLKQKSSAYIPPAFRSDNTNKSKIIKNQDSELNLEEDNQHLQSIINKTNKTKNINDIKVPNYDHLVNKNIGVWGSKSILIFNKDNVKDDIKDDIKDDVKDDVKDNIKDNILNKQSELKLSYEWEVNNDF